VIACAALAARTSAQEAGRGARSETSDEKRWQAVAPRRVEPGGGGIRVAAPIMGGSGGVRVKADEKVAGGGPLIRLADSEAQARLASAEAQVQMRKRTRNDEAAPTRAAARRRAEDGVGDAEKAMWEAQAALDKAVIERRAGRGSDGDLDSART